MLSIRPFENRDQDAVVHIIRTVFDEYGFGWEPDGYCLDVHDVPGHYGPPNNSFWVGELDGCVVGCGGLLTFQRLPGEIGSTVEHEDQIRVAGTDCELMRLYVLPEGRGKGVGSGILQAILNDARRRGCSHMEIWSDFNLKEAHAMYHRLGAMTVGERLCPPQTKIRSGAWSWCFDRLLVVAAVFAIFAERFDALFHQTFVLFELLVPKDLLDLSVVLLVDLL